ncbi:hypothetical protein [uncultured Sphingomonas sp.]|uniref:hypothetical protein n=1 Tax=uncultured Sphingomonas sp. TaxID=158754 RepID=UPI0035CA0CD8
MYSLGKALNRRQGLTATALLRLALVLILIVLQSIEVSDSFPLLQAGPVWALPSLCICMLAASLGFSAAESRGTMAWRAFAADQFRLSIPIYAAAVIAAMAVLGPLATNRGTGNYFGDPATYAYLLNLVGLPQFTLPGVFEFNDLTQVVNQNVWVAPVFVVVTAAICVDGRRRWAKAFPVILALVIVTTALLVQAIARPPGDNRDPAALFLAGDGLSAMLGALFGIGLFRGRRLVPIDWRLAMVAAVAMLMLAAIGDPIWLGSAVFRILEVAASTYLCVYLELRRPPLAWLWNRIEPYLVAMFLVSFPLQQAATQIGPSRQNFIVNVAAAGGAAIVIAVAYWYLIGRRIVGERRRTALATAMAVEAEFPRARHRVRRIDRAAIIVHLAVGLSISVFALGLLSMVYFALKHD